MTSTGNKALRDFHEWLDFCSGILSDKFRSALIGHVHACMEESHNRGKAIGGRDDKLRELVEECERKIINSHTLKGPDGHYLPQEERDAAAWDAQVEFREAIKKLIGMDD